jgi:hypothetical protein
MKLLAATMTNRTTVTQCRYRFLMTASIGTAFCQDYGHTSRAR